MTKSISALSLYICGESDIRSCEEGRRYDTILMFRERNMFFDIPVGPVGRPWLPRDTHLAKRSGAEHGVGNLTRATYATAYNA